MRNAFRILAVLMMLCVLTACSGIIETLQSGIHTSETVSSEAAASSESEVQESSVPVSSELSEIDAQSSQTQQPEESVLSSDAAESNNTGESSTGDPDQTSSSQEGSSSQSVPDDTKPANFGPIEYENLENAIRDLPGLYGRKIGSTEDGDEEGAYIEIFYEFGRFYASVVYTMNESVYSFAALELLPFDCRGSEMRFTAREYSVMSQWNQYGSVTSVILEPTSDGLRYIAEDEGGFFPKGEYEFTRTDITGPKAFMYSLEDLRTFIYDGLEEAESSDALAGSWTASFEGVMIYLNLDENGGMKMLIDDQDDFSPDRYFEGVYIAEETPGSLRFCYLGNILSGGGMPTSGEDTVALLDRDTFSVTAVQDGYIPEGMTIEFHRSPWAP